MLNNYLHSTCGLLALVSLQLKCLSVSEYGSKVLGRFEVNTRITHTPEASIHTSEQGMAFKLDHLGI